LLLGSAHAAIERLYGDLGTDISELRGHSSIQLIPDGSGGALFMWVDDEDGTVDALDDPRAYINQFNKFGRQLWPNSAVIDSPSSYIYGGATLLEHPVDGFYVLHTSGITTRRTYVNRYNSDGTVVWTNKVFFNSISYDRYSIKATLIDDLGNVFVLFTHCITGVSCSEVGARFRRLVLKGMDPNGNVFLSIEVRNQIDAQDYSTGSAKIIPDNSGGAYIAWKETEEGELRITHLDSSGSVAADWIGGDSLIVHAVNPGYDTPQGLGGLDYSSDGFIYVVATMGHLASTFTSIQVYKLNLDGTPAISWDSNGVTQATQRSFSTTFVPDHAGGYYVYGTTMEYFISGKGYWGDTWIHRFDSNGLPAAGWSDWIRVDAASWSSQHVLEDNDDIFVGFVNKVADPDNRLYYVTKYQADGTMYPEWSPNIAISLDASWLGLGGFAPMSDEMQGFTVAFGKRGTDGNGRPPSNVLAQRLNEGNLPLSIGPIYCDKGDGFEECVNMQFGNIITQVEAECTDPDYGIDRVRLRVYDPDNDLRADGYHTSVNGDFFILDGLSVNLDELGTWRVRADCYGFPGESDTNTVVWDVSPPSPPTIISADCDTSGAGTWVDCTTLEYNQMIMRTRAECTDPNGDVTIVQLTMTDPVSTVVYDLAAANEPATDYYVVDHADVTLDIEGSWQVDVHCEDSAALFDDATINWLITAPVGGPQPPIASATSASGAPDDVLTLSGAGSYDPDGGTIQDYSWANVLGDPSGCIIGAMDQMDLTIQCPLPERVLRFELTVTDDESEQGTDLADATWSVSGVNQPPIAVVESATGPINTDLALVGHNSNDPDGFIDSFAWSLVSGDLTGCVENDLDQGDMHIQCDSAKSLLYELTVTDNDAETDSAQAAAVFNEGGPGTGSSTPGFAIQELTVIALDCPRLVATDETQVIVQCLENGVACSESDILLTGAPNSFVSQEANALYYSVETVQAGDFKLKAETSFGSATCSIRRPQVEAGSLPDFSVYLIPLFVSTALYLRRRKA